MANLGRYDTRHRDRSQSAHYVEEPLYKRGAAILVPDENSTLHEAKVIKTEDGHVHVRFKGYDTSHNMWISEDLVTPIGADTPHCEGENKKGKPTASET